MQLHLLSTLWTFNFMDLYIMRSVMYWGSKTKT